MSSGPTRNNLETKKRETSEAEGRVRILEASVEATFQPVLQWYLLYPEVIRIFLSNNRTFGQLADNAIPYLSVASSIISLAWAFTSHKATYKAGALHPTLAPLSRVILFLSDLLFIISRMNLIVLFMYSFGPGQFYPGMVFLAIHFLIVVILHNIFTDEISHIASSRYLRYFHSCCINGMANMFSNNGEVTFGAKRKNRKTFVRHFVYDLVFVAENIVLATYGYNLAIKNPEEDDAKNLTILVSIISYFLGLLLKIIYYKNFHLWSGLIAVTHENSFGESVFETEFTCFNKTIKIEKIVWSNEEGKRKRRREADETQRIKSISDYDLGLFN
jgi:hypothetical protein